SPDRSREFWSGVARDDGLRAVDPRKRFLIWLQGGKRIRPGQCARGFAVAWRAFLESRDLQRISIDSSKPLDIRAVPLAEAVEEAASLRSLPPDKLSRAVPQPNTRFGRASRPSRHHEAHASP